jgi:hypothetical protein
VLKKRPSYRAALTATMIFASALVGAHAVSLDDLRSDEHLTPETFASYFSNFEFKFRADVQDAATFLSTRCGDCDDYGAIASLILKEKGYTPRLIAIRMPGMVHVVCYVEEMHGYLDYNLRHGPVRKVTCDNNLREVAKKVAKSFKNQWASASEFTFDNGQKRLVATVTAKELYASSSK